MTADVEPGLAWTFGVLVLFAAASLASIAYFIVSYPRWVSILLVCVIGVTVVPYVIGWTMIRATGIDPGLNVGERP